MPRHATRSLALPPSATLLDDALPLLVPTGLEIHTQAAVLEVSEPSHLLELFADRDVRPFLLGRLSSTVALVDLSRGQQLHELLRRRGHTPKLIKEPSTP